LRGEAFAQSAALASEDGVVVDGKHDAACPQYSKIWPRTEQSFKQRRRVAGDSRGKHEVLITLDRRDRIKLHGLQAADLLQGLLGGGLGPDLVAVCGQKVDRLEQKAADPAGCGVERCV
jgi:hypothetical protein